MPRPQPPEAAPEHSGRDRNTHSASNKAIELDYRAGRERIRRKDILSVTVGVAPNLVTHFVGNAEIVRYATGKVEVRRYVAGMIRVQTRETPTFTSTREDYLFTDAQGSTYALVKDTGSVLGIMGFDPWGLRRAATNWTPLANPLGVDGVVGFE